VVIQKMINIIKQLTKFICQKINSVHHSYDFVTTSYMIQYLFADSWNNVLCNFISNDKIPVAEHDFPF